MLIEPLCRSEYVLFAAEPYETVGFKIPNLPIDKREGKFLTDWSRERKVFTVSVQYQTCFPVLLSLTIALLNHSVPVLLYAKRRRSRTLGTA